MTPEAFRLDGERPTGTTVLEASAGTGKTYAIAGLAARYVAEGVPLERLLLVTFTRSATSELRERVRRRLTEVLRGLEGEPSEDVVVKLLAEGDRELHCERLRRALSDFDAATIATTHSFCEEMLGGLGIAADLDPDREFKEDVRDLRAEVVDDLFVWRLETSHNAPRPSYDDAKAIAKAAVDNPVSPLAAAPSGLPESRRRTADWTRRELDVRKRRMAVVTFDDLLLRLRDALTNDPGAIAQLSARYEVVLVDEFQDTDPVQWEILRTAFAHRTLVLIGDPKQAIYAFRGADVFAYLEAKDAAPRIQTLARNHRSDQPLIDAFDALFGNARLGHPEIGYLPVTAEHPAARLTGPPVTEPLRLRFALCDDLPERTQNGYAPAAVARAHIAADLAADVVGLLECPTAKIEGRRVQPSDVAVLTRTNRQAAQVRDALAAAGVPAVINGAGSVFETDPAEEWLRLLEALERPGHQLRAHAAALTCFFGWSAAEVAAPDADWEPVHDSLHDWAQVLRERGVAALMETITHEQGLLGRILGELGGERRLTDLRHVGQLLHGAAAAEGLGLTALTAWLRRRIAEAAEDTSNEERSRRLESDAQAVQVLTVHRSKGLEFGIVYLPFAWDRGYGTDDAPPVVFHDDDGDRVLDVALAGADYDEHRRRWRSEERGEDLRLLYVALTRARHQAVVWWTASRDAREGPLGRLLFGRQADGTVVDQLPQTPKDPEATPVLRALKARAGGTIALERALVSGSPQYSPPVSAPAELRRERFSRTLDASWRRTSYSALTAAAHEAPVASEPETAAVADEPETGPPTPGLWADVPAGVRVGTVVHRALEAIDFQAPEFGVEVRELGAVAGLETALAQPLGPPFGVRLADLAAADRLDELEFELPLARVPLRRVAEVLRAHGDPYADRLAELSEDMHGFLTGSLDLVARLPDGRFAVLDYKTNALEDFEPDALAAEMARRHYGLQALLYVVALHRYLRWRLPGYAVEMHLAGAGYLFLRGMTGEPGAGVYAWTPPAGLVEELSALFD